MIQPKQMKKDFQTRLMFVVTIIMLAMVLSIAKHYKDEVLDLKLRIKKLEILIEKYGRDNNKL